MSGIWRSGTARRLHILRDGFDSRWEPIRFDKYTGWLMTRRAQSPSITVEFSVQYNLKITSVVFSFYLFVSGSSRIKLKMIQKFRTRFFNIHLIDLPCNAMSDINHLTHLYLSLSLHHQPKMLV